MTLTEYLEASFAGKICTITHRGKSLTLFVNYIKIDTDDSLVVWSGPLFVRFRGLSDFGIEAKKESKNDSQTPRAK
jgi:hypothetical protein